MKILDKFSHNNFLLLIITSCFSLASNALILEELAQSGTIESTLSNKKICYYVGSFDPLHKGHEAVAELPLMSGICDYVLMYPSWGKDSYKTRVDVNLRLEMLFAVFKDHPRIIVTKFSPIELQTALTITNSAKIDNLPTVKPAFVC